MNIRFVKWIPVMLVVALAGCAQQPVRGASANRSHAAIDYSKYVQGTVPWFHFLSLDSWDSNQPGYVVVWTNPNEAYRLSVMGPCLGLKSAFAIGLTSHGGTVNTRDAVIVHGDRCPIMRIERLDTKAIKAARANQKSGSSADG